MSAIAVIVLPERRRHRFADLEARVAENLRHAAKRGRIIRRAVLCRESAAIARAHPEWVFGIPWVEGDEDGVDSFEWCKGDPVRVRA